MFSNQFLQRVIHREIRTFYSISEMLECGHRFESLGLLADPLTARHRICPKCQAKCAPKTIQPLACVPKKPSASIFPHTAERTRGASGG